jgi:hypothetical protein
MFPVVLLNSLKIEVYLHNMEDTLDILKITPKGKDVDIWEKISHHHHHHHHHWKNSPF